MKNLFTFSVLLAIASLLTLPYIANSADDLVFHFPFDEGDGDITGDKSENGLEGAVKNGEWVEGVVGQALLFNNGAVTVPAFGVDSPEEMTIEFWFKPTERIAGGNRIDLMYRLQGGGRPHITFNRAGIVFGCYLATNAGELEVLSTYDAFEPQWYYLVISQNQDTAVVYIDGKKDGETNTGAPARMDFGTVGMSIAANVGNANFFNGSIDELKMRSVALTAEEVKKNMDQALAVEAHDKLATTWGQIKSRN